MQSTRIALSLLRKRHGNYDLEKICTGRPNFGESKQENWRVLFDATAVPRFILKRLLSPATTNGHTEWLVTTEGTPSYSREREIRSALRNSEPHTPSRLHSHARLKLIARVTTHEPFAVALQLPPPESVLAARCLPFNAA